MGGTFDTYGVSIFGASNLIFFFWGHLYQFLFSDAHVFFFKMTNVSTGNKKRTKKRQRCGFTVNSHEVFSVFFWFVFLFFFLFSLS